MKSSRLILGVLSIMTLCLAACGKPNMSFEAAVDNIFHSELNEIMNDADYYQQNFNISTDFSIPDEDVKASISFSTDSKQNAKDSELETNLALNFNVKSDDEKVKVDGDASVKQIANVLYFKLNSLDIFSTDDDFDADELGIDEYKGQRFSFELTDEMINDILEEADFPEDFDMEKRYNEEKVDKLVNDLKKSINNDGALIYNGSYSQFSGYNAYKFSIDRDKAFMAFVDYLKGIMPDDMMDELMEEIEEEGLDEIFEDFPLSNFEGYLVITGKNRVQIVIENIDIEDYYSTSKMYGTFGRDGYEIVVNEDNEDVFVLSAMLNESIYDVKMIVEDEKVLKGTITPNKSRSKIGLDFDLSIDFDDYGDKIHIPLKGGRSREKVSKFNVEAPKDAKNILEEIMGEDYEDYAQGSKSNNQVFKNSPASIMTTPIIVGGIMVAALTPRMQSAQSRARDVARKTDLSMIQTAIVTSQLDKGEWPGINNGAEKGITVSAIRNELIQAGMSSVPSDPGYEYNYGLGEDYKDNGTFGNYLYLVAKRNGVTNGGFVVMAKTEVEGGSNRVVCEDGEGLSQGYITNDTDISKIKICNTVTKGNSCGINNGSCTYKYDDELRYILMY